jgi:hypothetical protein
MSRAVSKEDTSSRAKSKLASVVGPKIWPTGAPNGTKGLVVWLVFQELYWSFVFDDFAGKEINEIGGTEERFIPKF